MKRIKFLLGVGLLSLLTSSAVAQDSEPKNQHDLITVCKEDKLSKICETKKNGKLLRKISYSKGILSHADIYYSSGRLAKSVSFNNLDGQLYGIFIYPDKNKNDPNYKKDEYIVAFENGKFLYIYSRELVIIHSTEMLDIKFCDEDTPDGKKCDELNYFYPSSEPDLHPALALPIENQGLDVLKSNGIKLPDAF